MNSFRFKNLKEIPGLLIDLRYQSRDNFTGEKLYTDSFQAQLQEVAFEKIQKAAHELAETHPQLRLLILDALRPRSVQRRLYRFVEGTPQQSYVANPDRGSVHNFGMAVDLTLAKANGEELDMGTPFDDFSDLAQPQLESRFYKQGEISAQQLENRHLLRDLMLGAGFTGIPNEWWHFNALTFDALVGKYSILETEI
ncbi:MAG: M15 family metallopeptidase [Pseudobdellovibrionaceae bacterium]